ncbi:MAG TPA: methylated-DNA--[protein]-cysteine S-methyltransferase [Rhizomicrobium sp.]|nr:methylated-DNA--[protein]-cysteine S-methyltransferase [Rhizomicrobium sp.]
MMTMPKGKHFYSVKTTGVYCRPSCAARPKMENVRFHATMQEAERAGFRPCKRCRPEREALGYAIGRTWLGLTLVAESAKGVCAILFGTSRTALKRDLRKRFPDAALIETDRTLEGFVDGSRFALDPRGTAFQKEVWQSLRKIPAGRTASYADIAGAIGRPKAVRAVAQACAANPLAVAVPCHRVVASNGNLSGYRWGVERKKRLLAREAA